MGGTRGLTDGEIGMLSSIYGSAIDYSEVQVRNGGTMMSSGFTPNNTIRVGKDIYRNDYSLERDLDLRGVLVHETGHILQHQNGRPPLANALVPQVFANITGRIEKRYDYTDKLERGVDFNKWTIEEQARYFEHLYVQLEHKRGVPLTSR